MGKYLTKGMYGINTLVTFDGETKTVKEWAKEYECNGLTDATLLKRLNSGWNIRTAITSSLKKPNMNVHNLIKEKLKEEIKEKKKPVKPEKKELKERWVFRKWTSHSGSYVREEYFG